MAVSEATLEQTEIGLVTSSKDWIVRNARESTWLHGTSHARPRGREARDER